MFIELIDLLRCTKPHDETWLVAAFNTVSNRFVEEGKLGCPACSAEYWIRDGVGDFSGGVSLPARDAERIATGHSREELATRAGAYLDATEAGATVVLGGLWAYAAEDLSKMSDVRVLALNAPSEVKESERVGLLRVASEIPLATGSVLGVALDAWFPEGIAESAARVVRPRGRVVGPATLAVPSGLTVLAHDDKYWVAEKPPEVIPIRRASR
ncbi:MAG TPA: hypothetical protein VGL17_03155 [Gemmatimonadaceae bacterium]